MVVLKCGKRLPQVSEVVMHAGKTEATGQMVATAHRVTGDEEHSSSSHTSLGSMCLQWESNK